MLHEWPTAIRLIARRRGLALAIVLTLAAAIGATSVIFSAIDAVLFRPLPYPAGDRLVSVHEANARQQQATSLVAPVKLEEWNRMSRSFEGLAGTYFENMADTSGPVPERVEAMRTSARFFSVLGTRPALGRTVNAEEEAFGGPPVVVLSDAFWRARFNADPSVIGRSLMLDGVSRTIVGVMPPSFRYPTPSTDVWIPAPMSPRLMTVREARYLQVVGRLAAGVDVGQARKELHAIQQRLGEQHPQTDKDWTATVSPLKEEQVGRVRQALWLLFGAVLVLLLVACVNIACLLLADATRREQEIAVRSALGASRWMVIEQLLLEGLVLALTGSLLGLLLAHWGIQGLHRLATGLPRAAEIAVDWRLVAFTLSVGCLTTLLFALVPAWRATRREVAERLAHGGRAQIGGHQRFQRGLVAAQVMLAIVLLVGAGLLVRSFLHLQQISPGFDPDHVLTFRVSAGWGEPSESVANRQYRTLERLREIPGVTSAALSAFVPGGSDFIPPQELEVVGRDTGEQDFAVRLNVSADYFKTLRIPGLQGESCRDEVRPDDTRKVVVNRTFARRFFDGENPIGQQIVLGASGEIVGVVADVHEQGLLRDPLPTAYYCGLLPFWPDPYYIIRTEPSQAVTLTTIRRALREIEPQRSVFEAATLNETLAESLSQQRLSTILLALFGVMTLTLAAIGLYSMLAQLVSQRRREIGVRVALGAQPAQVLTAIVGQGAVVAGIGLLLGLLGAFALSRFMDALVFGISSQDPVTFAIVSLVLALVAGIATIVPGIRAVRIDPVRALREE
ncbi:MAG: FtsX-like permease family protein [Luteitalea sp.]|nr:FtsX-like permease family protein [Luteitalea sp.]